VKLFDIGFLSLRLLDIIDITLVAFLIYGLFKIVKGSIGFNIFIGFLSIFIIWFIVRAANMRLLSTILYQFISVGTIALLIVFQQEIRRFLLLIGKNRVVFTDSKKSYRSLLPWNWRNAYASEINFDELALACTYLSKSMTGALIILARSSELKFFTSTGILIDGDMSNKLLEAIFNKKSPLHDGAVIMVKNKIRACSCILPVSDASNLPIKYGLRHRSALGIAEQTDAMAVIVSEETGSISVASKGQISEDLSTDVDLSKRLFREYFELD
jgi:diadenylate cyclase